MAYKKPIIIEVFATIHLRDGTLVPPQFFDLVPLLKARGFTKIEMGQLEGSIVGPTGTSSELQITRVSVPKIRCWTEDDARLVQIQPDQLAANHVVRQGEGLGCLPEGLRFDARSLP